MTASLAMTVAAYSDLIDLRMAKRMEVAERIAAGKITAHKANLS
jgi:hypothetical protein